MLCEHIYSYFFITKFQNTAVKKFQLIPTQTSRIYYAIKQNRLQLKKPLIAK